MMCALGIVYISLPDGLKVKRLSDIEDMGNFVKYHSEAPLYVYAWQLINSPPCRPNTYLMIQTHNRVTEKEVDFMDAEELHSMAWVSPGEDVHFEKQWKLPPEEVEKVFLSNMYWSHNVAAASTELRSPQ